MIKNQPLPVSEPVAHHVNDVDVTITCCPTMPLPKEVRLLRTWLLLVAETAQVVAHGLTTADTRSHGELLDLLMEVEFTICTQVRGGSELLDSLTGWEAALLHVENTVRAEDCLICRRGRRVPDDLPVAWRQALNIGPSKNPAIVAGLGGGA